MKIFELISPTEITNIIVNLIKIESHKDYPGKESKIATHIKDFFLNEGIDAELDFVEPDRPNVYAYLVCHTKSPELMFNGHIDTIPGFDMKFPAYNAEVHRNVIYGRGACDMKGGLAAYMAAFAAIKRAGLQLAKPAMFAGVIGEEDCSGGTEHMIKNNIIPRLCVVAELTQLLLCTAHKGFEWMEVSFIGRSCHGSSPEKGLNAIYAAARFCELIRDELEPSIKSRLHPTLGHGSICIGVIAGGNQPNVVPNQCVVQLDRRFLPGEAFEDIYKEITDLAENAANALKCQYKFRPLKEMRASMVNVPHSIPNDDPFVINTLRICDQVLARHSMSTVMDCGWTDAGLYSTFSQAKCIILGPGDMAQAHTECESCKLDEIYQASEIYYEMMKHFCL